MIITLLALVLVAIIVRIVLLLYPHYYFYQLKKSTIELLKQYNVTIKNSPDLGYDKYMDLDLVTGSSVTTLIIHGYFSSYDVNIIVCGYGCKTENDNISIGGWFTNEDVKVELLKEEGFTIDNYPSSANMIIKGNKKSNEEVLEKLKRVFSIFEIYTTDEENIKDILE